MKSVGGLFEIITSTASLELALYHAAQGKRQRPSVQRFLADGPGELRRLRVELSNESYRPPPYQQFRIRDPKPRLISRADFRDRVVHHAICAQLAPVIEHRLCQGEQPIPYFLGTVVHLPDRLQLNHSHRRPLGPCVGWSSTSSPRHGSNRQPSSACSSRGVACRCSRSWGLLASCSWLRWTCQSL